MIKYCDTFCGLGGFSLAMHQTFGKDANCVWAIDFDKNPAETFKANFGIECLGNIREAKTQDIPDHDIILGGFPCQAFSRNGRWYNHNNKTIGDDERDNLFLELVRILDAKKPKYFIFENVKGLLSMKNGDGTLYFETIKDTLISCGYKIHVKLLDAADYGVAQQRERVFFVGIRNDIDQTFEFPKPIPRTLSISDVLETNVPSKYFLKNLWKNRKINLNCKPENAHKVNHSFQAGHSRHEVIKHLYDIAVKPPVKTGKIESIAILYGDTPSGMPRQQDKIYSVNGIAPTIATFSTPAIDSPQGLRQLTPRECARLQGIPDAHILPKKDSLAYKQIGNAVAVPVIAAIIKNLVMSSVALKDQEAS